MPKKKSIVFTFGRFQPPTIGHEKLITKVMDHAEGMDADHRIYASQSNDPAKNPLSHAEKVGFMRDMFPGANVVRGDSSTKTFMEVLYKLQDEGYETVHMVVGGDRVPEIKAAVKRYLNGKDKKTALRFKQFKVVSAGERDPDARGVEGMSASKMRAAVAAGNFGAFKKGLPKGFKRAKELFKSLQKGMGDMTPKKKKKPEAAPVAKGRTVKKPGSVWETETGSWGGKNRSGKMEYFPDRKRAQRFATSMREELAITESRELINEVTPPGEKSERFVKKSKAEFKKRYGEDWESYLYGVAWSQYNKRRGKKNKTRLGEPITEAEQQEVNEAPLSKIKRHGKGWREADEQFDDEKDAEKWLISRGWKSIGTDQETGFKSFRKGRRTAFIHVDTTMDVTVQIKEEVEPIEEESILDTLLMLEATIPAYAWVKEINREKKTAILQWTDDNGDPVEEEVPMDEIPGFFAGASKPLRTRKTDKFGNLLSKMGKINPKKTGATAQQNQQTATELKDLIDGKPMGTVITIYGKKYGKKDDHTVNLMKRRLMGREIYVLKSTGKEVELNITGAGLQVVDAKSKRILLDKGNDATW